MLAEAVLGFLPTRLSVYDGAYQTYNPLRRIDLGQKVGVDFQFFHGPLIPYLHYPIHHLLGGTFPAAELARAVISPVFFLVGSLLLFMAFTGKLRDAVVPMLILLLGFPEVVQGLSEPGHSLLGVRSTMPIVPALLLAWMRSGWWRAALIGLALALAVLLGTEHGIAAFVAVALARLGTGLVGRDLGLAVNEMVVIVLAMILGIAALLVPITGLQGALSSLRYNLVVVPAEQFWYFGVPPNSFASRWGWNRLFVDRILVLILVAIALVRTRGIGAGWRQTSQPSQAGRSLAAVYLSLYGLLTWTSCFGILYEGYLLPFDRLMIQLLILIGCAAAGRWIAGDSEDRTRSASRRTLILPLLALAFYDVHFDVRDQIVGALKSGTALVTRSRQGLSLQIGSESRAMMDGIIARIEQDRRDHPSESELSIWSLYTGLVDAHYGQNNPSCDYIIHALGPRARQDYLETFRTTRPRYVITLNPRTFPYSQWLQQTSWPFFEDLLNNYGVLLADTDLVLWKRDTTTWVQPESLGPPLSSNGDGSFTLGLEAEPPPADSLVVVGVKYRVDNPWKRVPFFGRLPRLFAEAQPSQGEPWASLPPDEVEVTWPVCPSPRGWPTIRPVVRSLLPGVTLTIEECRYRVLHLPAAERAQFEPSTLKLQPTRNE
jgi:hypothetical protein